MFGLSPATKIFLAVDAIDMRKGFEGLYGLVRDKLGGGSLERAFVPVHQRSRTRLKALVWDGSGLWVCAKRLETGDSAGRKGTASVASRCGAEELAMLVNGLDLTASRATNWLRGAPAA